MGSGSVRRRFTAIRRRPSLFGSNAAPVGDTAALGAEMKPKRVSADVGLGCARDVDSFALVVICPEHAIAATCRAVACGRRLGHPVELPLNRSAMT